MALRPVSLRTPPLNADSGVTCLSPRIAWQYPRLKANGKTHISFATPSFQFGNIAETIMLPCKKCLACRLTYAREWATRCVHEASKYTDNSFLTLTFDNEHLPADQCLDPQIHVAFMDKLRDYVGERKIRYYMSGEYGEQNGRCHLHYLCFNWTPPDPIFLRKTKTGHPVYQSETLARLWGRGFVTIGNVSFQSAGYVARYVVKKSKSDTSEQERVWWNPNTEEYQIRTPEFNRMSCGTRKDGLGGIGKSWITDPQNLADTLRDDNVIINGQTMPVPAYYNQILEVANPERYAEIKLARKAHALAHAENHTEERLAVRRAVLAERVKGLDRTMS